MAEQTTTRRTDTAGKPAASLAAIRQVLCGLSLVAVLAVRTVAAAGLPPEIAKQLGGRLPAAFVPTPASGAAKLFPLLSAKHPSPDRKYAISVGETPFAITALSDDGKLVEMMVPAGLHTAEFTNRWFKAEDVFGKIKWNLAAYTPEVPCLAYFSGGKGPLELVAKIPGGTPCAALGTVAVGKTQQKLVQVRRDTTASGQVCTFMLAFVRENPPVKTKAEYDARAKQMMAEHAFRNGRDWGKGFPSILGNTSCFECAAMAADAATYMFDGSLKSPDSFDKAEEIRAGDVVHFKTHYTHYIFVIYRSGTKLTTIEGNMNDQVSQSSSRYAVVDGKFMVGGQEHEFLRGYHHWTLPGKR